MHLIICLRLSPQHSQVSQTFTGTYDWSDGDVGKLVAEFKPDGEGAWTVQFDFNWNGQDRTWTGTAQGTLGAGERVDRARVVRILVCCLEGAGCEVAGADHRFECLAFVGHVCLDGFDQIGDQVKTAL